MFDIFYNWFYEFFSSTNINSLSFDFMGNVINLTTWLSITATIISLILILFLLFNVVKWIFSIFANTINRI